MVNMEWTLVGARDRTKNILYIARFIYLLEILNFKKKIWFPMSYFYVKNQLKLFIFSLDFKSKILTKMNAL